jgi:site-specific recombinase XerD
LWSPSINRTARAVEECGGRGPALLFARIERKKTWLMVKKDLERVGIAYDTPEGIADFHAAGRHSHITGLIRSGASIMEAKELARHADIRQTAKYTHIGWKTGPKPWLIFQIR